MFAVGQAYIITMLQFEHDGPNEERLMNCIVTDYDLPLLRLKQGDKVLIINTSSPAFVRATPQLSVTESARGSIDITPPDFGTV